MKLSKALFCACCEEIFEPDPVYGLHCPVCASKSVAWVTRWLPSLAAPVKRKPSEIVREELFGKPDAMAGPEL